MEVKDEYNYDGDYGDIFTKFVLNISLEDLENMSLVLNQTYTQTSGPEPYDQCPYFAIWKFALNVISGLGILTNTLLMFLLVVDFVIDRKRLPYTRHWLLMISAVTHVAYLCIGIYMRENSIQLGEFERKCLVFKHTEKTIQFVVNVYYVVIAMNVLANIIRPKSPCGRKTIILWMLLILFIMICGNLAIFGLFTMQMDISEIRRCDLDSTPFLPPGSVYLLTIITFFLPYGIVLVLAFTSLLYSCVRHGNDSTSLTNDNYFYITRKQSATFIFITSTTAFLLMLPYYLYKVPEVTRAVRRTFVTTDSCYVSYFTECLKLLNYVLFPVYCLCLKEVREIYGKAKVK